jgi:peptide deformylase
MLQPLVTFPDPRLRKPAKQVPTEHIGTDAVQQLAQDLVDTCNVHYGLGLAANQIGCQQSMVVVRPRGVGAENPDPYEGNDKFWVMINPKVTSIVSLENIKNPEKMDWKEGCLSFPGLEVNVTRYKHINLEWTDLKGMKHSKDFDWPLSGVIQHEVEHLSGHNMTQGKRRTARALILSDYKKKLIKKARKEKKAREEEERLLRELGDE